MADPNSEMSSSSPDPRETDKGVRGISCPYVCSIVSQLQHDTLHTEQISRQFWLLADTIHDIAAQHDNDFASHSASLADHSRNDKSEHAPISSEHPSFGNQDWESWTPLSDLFSNPLSASTTDGNNRWILETSPTRPDLPLNAPDPQPPAPDDGTCKPLDPVPSSDLYDPPPPVDVPEPEPSFISERSASRTPSRDYVEDVDNGEEEEESMEERRRARASDLPTPADSTRDSREAQSNLESQSPANFPVHASAPARDSALSTPRGTVFDTSHEAGHEAESGGREAGNTTTDGSETTSEFDQPPAPPKQTKRKSSDFETDVRTSKSRRTGLSKAPQRSQPASVVGSDNHDRANIPQKLVELSSDLTEISQKVLEPNDVYDVLSQRADKKYHHKLDFLTRLFFAIASPQAFRQLTDACTIVRQHHESTILYPANDDSALMKALDVLDAKTAVRAILRRFYLIRLLEHRIQREDYYKKRRSARVRAQYRRDYKSIEQLVEDPDDQLDKKSMGKRRPGRPDANAFADLLATFYPNLHPSDRLGHLAKDREYRENYWKLKNRLKSARNWYLLQQRFSPGILALVPCGEFKIGNDKFEKIPGELFTVFLDVLCQYRGRFLLEVGQTISQHIQEVLHGQHVDLKYGFEYADTTSLLLEPMDSQRFIRLCDTNASPDPNPDL